MTYIPPDEKKSGGTSTIGDIVYVILFYLVEGLFIFLGIPMLVLAIGVIPIAMYVIITEGKFTQWPLYVAGVFVVLLQVFGIQYALRKYVLEPHKKTFGEWLRWKFSPTEIKKRRLERKEKTQKIEEWYEGFDRVKDQKEKLKDEQSQELYSKLFPEISKTHFEINSSQDDSIIILGEQQKSHTSEDEVIEESSINLNSVEIDHPETQIHHEIEDDEEESEEINIEW